MADQIGERNYNNNPFVQAFLRKQAAASEEGAAGAQSVIDSKLKSKSQKDTIDRATALQKENSGSNISVGADSAAISHDFNQANMHKVQENIGKDNKKLSDAYEKLEKPFSQLAEKYQKGLSGLARGDDAGVNQAVIALAGTTEGATQRLLGHVVDTFGGNKTAFESAANYKKFLTGLQETGKTDAYQQSLKNALQAGYEEDKANFNSKLAEFKMRAPNIATTAAQYQNNFPQSLDSYGSAMRDRFGAIDKSMEMLGQQKQQKAEQAQAKPPGIMDKLAGLFNKSPQEPPRAIASAPPQGAPMAPAPQGAGLQGLIGKPAAPQGFDPDGYINSTLPTKGN